MTARHPLIDSLDPNAPIGWETTSDLNRLSMEAFASRGAGVQCGSCRGYTTPPVVWHGVVPPPICTCRAKACVCPSCHQPLT